MGQGNFQGTCELNCTVPVLNFKEIWIGSLLTPCGEGSSLSNTKGGNGMNFMSMSLQGLRVLLITGVIGLAPLAALNAQEVESQLPDKELIGPKLEPFAGAYKQISEIHTTYAERIIQSENEAKSDALQEEANQKMSQVVTDHGLTIADYNTIFQSIQNDPALKEEFMTVLNRTR